MRIKQRSTQLVLIGVLSLLMFAFVGKNTKSYTGQVTNELGESIKGVAVVVNGGEIQTVTNKKGEYKFTIKNDVKHLMFQKEGFKKATASVGINNRINVTMVSENSQLSSDTSLEDLMQLEVISIREKKKQ